MNKVWRQIARLKGLPRGGIYYAYAPSECPHERVKVTGSSDWELGHEEGTGTRYSCNYYKCKQCGSQWEGDTVQY